MQFNSFLNKISYIFIDQNFDSFSIIFMRLCSKSIKTEAIFTKTEMSNEWSINFLQISLLDIQHTYSSKFSIGWNISFDMVQNCGIYF